VPDSRFIAYLPCKIMENATYPALHSAMADSAPALAAELEALRLPGMEGSGFGFVLAGVPMTCVRVPAALPTPEWQQGAQSNLAWPLAGEDIAACRQHLVVAPVSEVEGHRDAQRKALAITVAVACLGRTSKAAGVVWVPAHSATRMADFEAMAKALIQPAEQSALPLDSWMRVEFGKMEGRYAAVARGLQPFIGHDLGALSAAPDPHGQAALLYNVAGYLIRNGAVIVDGDTMDVGVGKLRARMSADKRMLWLEAV
jgi:hypothetical protein